MSSRTSTVSFKHMIINVAEIELQRTVAYDGLKRRQSACSYLTST
jgi:hypothetical protein